MKRTDIITASQQILAFIELFIEYGRAVGKEV